jgi:hypothetical protein
MTDLLIHNESQLTTAFGTGADKAEHRAVAIFHREILRRSGLDFRQDVEAPYTLVFGTPASSRRIAKYLDAHRVELAGDAFVLDTVPDANGRIYVAAQTRSGVVAGTGKLLRLCRYGDGEFTIPCVHRIETPQKPVRGMYFASHFGNFYEVAPVAEVDAIIEDLALWGANRIAMVFPFHHFD